MSQPPADTLALGEHAFSRFRLTSMVDGLGPLLERRHPDAIDHVVLAEGLRWEAASISGALALRNVSPFASELSDRIQVDANNTSDGLYDFVEGEQRLNRQKWPKITQDERDNARNVAPVASLVGINKDTLRLWWYDDHPAAPEDEIAEAGLAAHIYLTTERFGRAPPVRTHGRNGDNIDLLAPDVVNTWEHLEAQLYSLRRILGRQRALLQHMVVGTEDKLLAAYDVLYENAPGSDAHLARRYFVRDGEITGGFRHIRSWLDEWQKGLDNSAD